MKLNIRLLYLYLFSFVSLLISIIGGIKLVDLGLKTYVFQISGQTAYYQRPILEEKLKFTELALEEKAELSEEEIAKKKETYALKVEEMKKLADKEEMDQKKRQASNALAMIIVGIPTYLYHWRIVKNKK